MNRFKSLIFNHKTLLFLIILLAAFLRLYKIADYMTFLGDEGRDALVVYNILHGKLTFLGPTASVGGFFLGPIYYYFMAIFTLIFNYSPVGPSVMVALFGIATVWLLYTVGKNFFNVRVGIFAALLYAVSPLVIAYSRSSWNPNPLPFFSLLSLYLLYQATIKDKASLYILCGVLLGIAIQLHYLTLFLLTIVVFYVFLEQILTLKSASTFITQLCKKYVLLFLGFIVGVSPFLAFEVRHGFPNTQSIFNFIFHSKETGPSVNFFSIIGDVFYRIFGRLVLAVPNPDRYFTVDPGLLQIWQFCSVLIGLISLAVLVYFLATSYKDRKKFLKYALLSCWLFLGILLFGFYRKAIYDYYFGFMFPLPFLVVSLTFDFIGKNSWLRIISYFVLIPIIILNLYGLPFREAPNRQLNQMETISDFVLSKTDNKPFNFALITGGNSDYAYRYFFTIKNREPVTINNAVIDPKRTTVTDQLLVVCETVPCQPLGYSLWEIAGFGQADIAGEWSVSVVKVYKLVPHKGK